MASENKITDGPNRILVLNANTSVEMTSAIEETVTESVGPETEIVADCPDSGPESLESYYEYHLAAVAMLEKVDEYRGNVDGVVVACYGDPGMFPLKEVLEVPVVGVAEASMAIATLLGHQFAILVALDRAVPMMENLVQTYGLSQRLAAVEPTGLSVLELENDREHTLQKLTEAGEQAMKEGAEVFLLGCSGMAGYEKELKERLDVPVINPVANAVTTLEALLKQDLTQSQTGLWATPPMKEMEGEIPGDSINSR